MSQCPNYERDNLEENIKDPIVKIVINKYKQRSNIGIKKYNTTLEENNKDNFLLHLQQEIMDASLYTEKILQQNKNITELCELYPNNQELGKIIRKTYGS